MPASVAEAIRRAVDPDRLVRTAMALIDAPSPTCQAGPAADCLASLLNDIGLAAERPVADWPVAPAVVARLASGRPGRTLQFHGHLDTVHLPFVPARCADGVIYGSGAADMKGGLAAAVEALRVLGELDALPAGAVMLTATDHHEGPWGDKRQLQALIRDRCYGDGVLIPEYLADRLPVAGRGLAIFSVLLERDGAKVHEVLAPAGTPDLVAAGADLVQRFGALNRRLATRQREHAGCDSVFVGQFTCGEIYNQYPTECRLAGTRRWVAPGQEQAVRGEFDATLAATAAATGARVTGDFVVYADAFTLDPQQPLVTAFQAAYSQVTGRQLPPGGKPFVDDGHTFAHQAGIPAITHGPAATGAHSLDEAVAVDELVRTAQVLALTAVAFGPSNEGTR